MNKTDIKRILPRYFLGNPDKTIPVKTIFRDLKFSTHPQKMLAIDVMEEMEWEDFIVRDSATSWRLRQNGSQSCEGTFIRRPNGRNSFRPDGGGKALLEPARNSLFAKTGDKVRESDMARR